MGRSNNAPTVMLITVSRVVSESSVSVGLIREKGTRFRTHVLSLSVWLFSVFYPQSKDLHVRLIGKMAHM